MQGRQLQVGGADDRAAVAVRRDLHAVGFRDRGDLLALEEAPAASQVGLGYVDRTGRDELGELDLVDQPLAGGDGDGGAAANPGHPGNVIRWDRLLEPQRVEGF